MDQNIGGAIGVKDVEAKTNIHNALSVTGIVSCN
jgi:hypothetical protein